MAQKKFIVIDIIVLDSLPNILADKRSCKQILINLLSNAIKFSPEGSKIVVSAEREGSFIKVVVKDNGVGISKHHLSEITKPFYRVQENSEIAAAGTGLGLSIVKSLLDAHHCDFNISSAVGKGTTVEFFLPIFE